MDEVRTALNDAHRQLAAIGTLYEADLDLQRPSPTLRGKIKGFLGSQRAALDHLAEAVVAASGAGGAHTHYPFARETSGFAASIDKNMPGVRAAQPEVAAVIGRHQPCSQPALAVLRDLLTDPTRQRLTPLTRERPQPEATDQPAGTTAAAVEPLAPSPPAPPVYSPTAGGAVLSGGLFIDGVSFDPTTLLRQQEEERQASKEIYLEWRFEGSDTSALATLAAIDAAVRSAVDEVAASAGLAVPQD